MFISCTFRRTSRQRLCSETAAATRQPVAVVTSVGVVTHQLLSTEVHLQTVIQSDFSLPDPPNVTIMTYKD